MSADPSSIPNLPLGTSLVPGGLELTFGIPFVAIIISSFLTGILTLQTFKYYIGYPNDALALKVAVGAIYVLDVAQFASIVDFTWWYLVRNWGNLGAIGVVRISYGLAVAFSTPVVLIVQLIYIYRIYRLNPQVRRIWIPISVLLCLVLIESAFGWRGSSFGLRPITFVEANHEKGQYYVVGLWLGSGAAADVGIASALVYNLVTRRTGFKRTDNLITKLVIYTINTAAFTSLVSVADIICFYAMPKNNAHLGLNMLLCKLFSNSLLASLNRRAERRRHDQTETTFAAASGFSVSVHTTKDTYSDAPTLSVDRPSHISTKRHNMDIDGDADVEMFPIGKTVADEA